MKTTRPRAMRLAVAIACVMFAVPLVLGQAKKPSIGNLKGNLKSVKGKKGAVAKELRATKARVRAVKGDLNELDARLTRLESDLETTTNRLAACRTLQRQVAHELELATERLRETKMQVQHRLKWMYMRENHTVADTLISSGSLAEFASRGFLLQRIAHADRDLFDRFKAAQREVSNKKQRADALVREVAGLKSRQVSQQFDLNETRQDKQHVLGQLREKQADLEKLIRQLDQEESSIQARINAYYRSQRGGKSPLPTFTGRMGRPCNGRLTSGFGMRFHPILKRNRMHTGVDFGAGHGSAIYAAADGIVISASYSRGYGNMVMVDHGGGISTLYGHCSGMSVRSGQKVKRGQRIASVGSTGLSTGPHLHFEVRRNGKPINPMGWL